MHILDTGPIFKFLTTDCVPELLCARAGEQVILVCDETAGTNVIKQQAKVLTQAQRRGQFSPGGSIQHADTIQLLWWAIEGGGFNGSREQFLTKYKAMAALDSSMPLTAKKVGLTKSPPWPPDAKRER